MKTYGQLDVLFNNAGVGGKWGPISELQGSDFDTVFLTNVKGVWLAMKHALPHLAKTKGAIVNNGSVVADIGMADVTVYSASKGAVHTLDPHRGHRVHQVRSACQRRRPRFPDPH